MKAKSNIKKTFFEVEAPLTSSKISLYGESVEQIAGRTVTLDLTRSLKGKSFEVKFKVKNEAGKLVAEPLSMWLVGSYIRRMIRNGTDYIEDSFVVDCKDAKVVIKPFLITRHKVSREVQRAIRNEAKKTLEEHLKTRTLKELFSEIMSNKIQKDLSFKLKKIYPLALCEIRVFETIVSNEVKREVRAEKVEETVAKEEVKKEKKAKKE